MLVSTKQHYNKEFLRLIASIKKASSKGLELVFFKKRNSHDSILKLLLTEGIIISFQEHANFLIIRLKPNTNRNVKSLNTLSVAQRLGRKNLTVSLQELIKLQRREGMSAYYILNTDQGLATSFVAIEKGIGGKLLIKIS